MSGKRTEPLRSALSIQRAAAREGFDWRHLRELWSKLAEEIGELQSARTRAQRRDELGDLLFMLVNLARHLEVDPTRALQGANRKFLRRYAFIRRHADTLPPLGDRRRLAAMEALWQQAKQRERRTR